MSKIDVRQWSKVLLLLTVGLLSSCASTHQPFKDVQGTNDLTVELWTSTRCADLDETVTLRATVTNSSSKPFIVMLKDQPVFDLIIEDYKGAHRWSDAQGSTLDLTRLELDGGASKTIEMQWLAKGEFVASARFIYNQRVVQNPINPNFTVFVYGCPGGFPLTNG